MLLGRLQCPALAPRYTKVNSVAQDRSSWRAGQRVGLFGRVRGARWASGKSLSKGIEAAEGCQAEGCMVTWWAHMADGAAERVEEVLGCQCALCTAWG